MRFWQAMQSMEQGCKVRCVEWEEGYYIDMNTILTADPSVTSKQWEIKEEPNEILSFEEVVKGLREGKRFKRQGWASDLALFVMGNEIYPRSKFGIETLRIEDFEADDWMEVKE